MEVINFEGLTVGGLRLRKDLATTERLTKLFALDGDAIFLNADGEEVEDLSQLSSQQKYTIVCEEDLADDSPFQKDPTSFSLEDRRKFFIKRQQRLAKMERERRKLISEYYHPKHPEIFKFSDDFLHPQLREAVEKGTMLEILTKLSETKLFTFPVFTDYFCNCLIEEVEFFEGLGLPIIRPNTMNNYGVVLDEIGFTPFLSDLRTRIVQPLAQTLYSSYLEGEELDQHHGFIVQYRMDEDLSLSFHYDDAEVTLNVCLGRDFKDGSLYFSGYLFDPSTHSEHQEVSHKVGYGLLHLGKHRHGANQITAGQRYNLILWCRSTGFRIKEIQNDHSCSCCHLQIDENDQRIEDEGDHDGEEHGHSHSHGHSHAHGHGHSHGHSHSS